MGPFSHFLYAPCGLPYRKVSCRGGSCNNTAPSIRHGRLDRCYIVSGSWRLLQSCHLHKSTAIYRLVRLHSPIFHLEPFHCSHLYKSASPFLEGWFLLVVYPLLFSSRIHTNYLGFFLCTLETHIPATLRAMASTIWKFGILAASASQALASCAYGTLLHPRGAEGHVEVSHFGYTASNVCFPDLSKDNAPL